MAAFEPFEPAVKSGTAGFTQVIAIGSGAATSQTIQVPSSTSQQQNAVLVTAANATAGTVAYVRLSVEASGTITATATDTPIVFPSVRLFASPNPGGAYNIAVVVTATPSAAGSVWFTPGQGGVV